MKHLLLACLFLIATSALAEEALKVFSDKGSFFVKPPKGIAFKVGDELHMATDAAGQKAAGTAVVMEVVGPLVRISLDDDAAKASARFARRPGPSASAEAAGPPPPTPAPAALSAPPPPPPLAEAGPAKPEPLALKGRIQDGIRVMVYNESNLVWKNCEFRYDTGRSYPMGDIPPMSDDGVLQFKFSSPPKKAEPLYDSVVVRCDQGTTKFLFGNAQSPGDLLGFAEDKDGRVTVHNTGDRKWTRCDVSKPNGMHYIMADLSPHDTESIRPGAFNSTDHEPRATLLTLKCEQGEINLPLR